MFLKLDATYLYRGQTAAHGAYFRGDNWYSNGIVQAYSRVINGKVGRESGWESGTGERDGRVGRKSGTGEQGRRVRQESGAGDRGETRESGAGERDGRVEIGRAHV